MSAYIYTCRAKPAMVQINVAGPPNLVAVYEYAYKPGFRDPPPLERGRRERLEALGDKASEKHDGARYALMGRPAAGESANLYRLVRPELPGAVYDDFPPAAWEYIGEARRTGRRIVWDVATMPAPAELSSN